MSHSESDAEVMEYAIDHGLIVITCNRMTFFGLRGTGRTAVWSS
jgi:hypothetical protein